MDHRRELYEVLQSEVAGSERAIPRRVCGRKIGKLNLNEGPCPFGVYVPDVRGPKGSQFFVELESSPSQGMERMGDGKLSMILGRRGCT